MLARVVAPAPPATLAASVEAARQEVGRPLGLHPDSVSPFLVSTARAWHIAMEPAERNTILAPVLPRLAGTLAAPDVESRRAAMAADFAVRQYLPAWFARAGLETAADRFARLPALSSLSDALALRTGIEIAAAEANAAWIAARERAKAATPPEAWDAVREDVRTSLQFFMLPSAEATVRLAVEDGAWAKAAHFLWEAAAACFWAAAWDGVRYGTAETTVARVAAAVLPLRADLNRRSMELLDRMASVGAPAPAPSRPAFHDPAEFPALAALAQHWPAMRADLDALRAPLMDVDRVGKPHAAVVAEVGQRVAAGEPFGWVKGWGGADGGPNADWVQYGLVLNDRAIPFARAPRTLRLLSGLRGLKVAAFARLAPGAVLPEHTHPEVAAEGLLQAHVTLKAPPACALCLLNVAGDLRQHVEGGLLVFDGSLSHWAANLSGGDRVILYLEFHRAAFHQPRAGA